MKIQVLYVDRCPHWERTVERVRFVVGERTSDYSIEAIRIGSMAEATRARFLGSPTVRIEGVDIEPEARTRMDFGLTCRLYSGSGLPPVEMISAAIQWQS